MLGAEREAKGYQELLVLERERPNDGRRYPLRAASSVLSRPPFRARGRPPSPSLSWDPSVGALCGAGVTGLKDLLRFACQPRASEGDLQPREPG